MIDKSKRIDLKELHYLWHSDYWDGPLSGLAFYKGEKLWFKLERESYSGRYRRFNLYRLLPEQLKYEEDQHQLFCEHVGTHCNYYQTKIIDGLRRDLGKIKPQVEWKKFYNIPHKEIDFSKTEYVGYYIL